MKFMMNTLVAVCGLVAATQVHAHRGNDFGNGGDPIREVFNAGRVFALDLLEGSKENELVRDLTVSERSTYQALKASAVEHLRVAEHQWDDWSQSSCARVAIDNPNIIRMSYDMCATEAPHAVAATRLLLEAALRSHGQVADFAAGKAIAVQLVKAWASANPESYAKAKSFSLTRATVTGSWVCSDATYNQTYHVEVLPVGLVKAPLALFPGSIADDKLEFVTFLTLNQARDQFRAEGILKRLRPLAQKHDNIIYAPTCDYPFALDLIQSTEDNAMIIQFDASGRPRSSEGCGVGLRMTRTFLCRRP